MKTFLNKQVQERLGKISFKLFFEKFQLRMQISFSGKLVRVWIVASHFPNYEMNSSYCDCKVGNHLKIAKQFYPKENLIRPNYILPHYTLFY